MAAIQTPAELVAKWRKEAQERETDADERDRRGDAIVGALQHCLAETNGEHADELEQVLAAEAKAKLLIAGTFFKRDKRGGILLNAEAESRAELVRKAEWYDAHVRETGDLMEGRVVLDTDAKCGTEDETDGNV